MRSPRDGRCSNYGFVEWEHVKKSCFALVLISVLTFGDKTMYLYTAFCAEHTVYSYIFCSVLCAHLCYKLSLSSRRFQWSGLYSCILGCHKLFLSGFKLTLFSRLYFVPNMMLSSTLLEDIEYCYLGKGSLRDPERSKPGKGGVDVFLIRMQNLCQLSLWTGFRLCYRGIIKIFNKTSGLSLYTLDMDVMNFL